MSIRKVGLSLLAEFGHTFAEGTGYCYMHRPPVKQQSTLGTEEYSPYFQMNLKYTWALVHST